jgi:hypothetical protein
VALEKEFESTELFLAGTIRMAEEHDSSRLVPQCFSAQSAGWFVQALHPKTKNDLAPSASSKEY